MDCTTKHNILVIMPDFYDYPKILEKTLVEMGHNVIVLTECVKENIHTKIQRKFLKPAYKRKIDKMHASILAKINKYKFSRVLYIFGGIYGTPEFIRKLKKQHPEAFFIYYNRDTVSNFPKVLKFTGMFDKIFSFDKKDCQKYMFEFLPLFFVRSNGYEEIKNNECLFLISFKEQKLDGIKDALKEIPEGILVKKMFYVSNKFTFFIRRALHNKKYNGFKLKDFIFKKIPYEKVLQLIDKYSFVIDVPMNGQNGLSIRTFETLSRRTKLITGNKNILSYDFYNRTNIYVINDYNNDKQAFFNDSFEKNETFNKEYNIEVFLTTLLSLN